MEGRVPGQSHRPLEECRGCRETTATLRSLCGAFQVCGHGLVRFSSRKGSVPGAAVGGELVIAHLRQRVVHPPSFADRRGSIYRGAHQRVVEPNAVVNFQQPGFRRGNQRARAGGKSFGRPPEHRGVAQRLRGRQQHESPRRFGQTGDAPQVPLLEQTRHVTYRGWRKAPGPL